MDHAPADDSPENIADVNADIDALIDGEIPPGMMDEASGRELVVINSSMPDKEAYKAQLKARVAKVHERTHALVDSYKA